MAKSPNIESHDMPPRPESDPRQQFSRLGSSYSPAANDDLRKEVQTFVGDLQQWKDESSKSEVFVGQSHAPNAD